MAKLPRVIDPSLHLPRPPFWLISALIIATIASWVPLVFVVRTWSTTSDARRVHLFHDMDHQPKLKAQDTAGIFADGRAMRPRIPGTVARGELRADDHLHRGYRLTQDDEGGWTAEYFTGYPDSVTVDLKLIEHGREQYNIACTPCHGEAGYGDGRIHQVASGLAANTPGSTSWVQPKDLHELTGDGELMYGEQNYPNGKLFHVITNGINNMPGYGSQLDVRDRWAVVAYVRALQLSQRADPELLTPEQRAQLTD